MYILCVYGPSACNKTDDDDDDDEYHEDRKKCNWKLLSNW